MPFLFRRRFGATYDSPQRFWHDGARAPKLLIEIGMMFTKRTDLLAYPVIRMNE